MSIFLTSPTTCYFLIDAVISNQNASYEYYRSTIWPRWDSKYSYTSIISINNGIKPSETLTYDMLTYDMKLQ